MISKPLRVLIVEDSTEDTELLLHELKLSGYNPMYERVDTADGLKAALDQQKWDVVFADHSIPHLKGLAALMLLKERNLDIPFIFVSGPVGEDVAVAALKAGANDYITKGNLKRLIPAVEREIRETEIRRERKQAEKIIQHMAYYDTLTDLPNRNRIYDYLLNAIRADNSKGNPMALLLMDLDRFKEINNTLGHHRGDQLLQAVGKSLRKAVWESDIVARLGGDEFAVLLPRLAAAEHINIVIQKILKTLEAPFVIEGLPIAVEASIGIVLYPNHGSNPDILMQRAEVAMYAAKQTGIVYVIYDAKHDQHSPRRLSLMGELRQAIDSDQLLLHYQPKIDLRTNRVSGVEALTRWQRPQYGFIPPDQFIVPAEQTGLIEPLTRWVLNTALSQCKTWHQAGRPITISVNLSARNLHNPQLPDQVADLLQNHGVASSQLVLEITESAIMVDPAHAMEILTRLSKIGVRLSIDDFGTGYSSLGYLKRLPVQEIKIDKSFVKDMGTDEDDTVIVLSIINLAHNLDLKVVAEGVENQGIRDQLNAFGCDAAQGYFWSHPLPIDEVTRCLDESPWGLAKG